MIIVHCQLVWGPKVTMRLSGASGLRENQQGWTQPGQQDLGDHFWHTPRTIKRDLNNHFARLGLRQIDGCCYPNAAYLAKLTPSETPVAALLHHVTISNLKDLHHQPCPAQGTNQSRSRPRQFHSGAALTAVVTHLSLTETLVEPAARICLPFCRRRST